jgi:hypothetical protein
VKHHSQVLLVAVWAGWLGLILQGATVHAQCTDDLNDCTVNDACDENGTCRGAPVPDGTPCHTQLSDCLVNPTCLNGDCVGGETAPDGAACRTLNSPCFDLGHCFLGFCMDSNPIPCPDDGDPCTSEFCSPVTQRCESFPQCPDVPCAVGHCDPLSGECTYAAIHEGEVCDDFDSCTTNERCQAGDCVGVQVETPTSTATPLISNTPTLSPTLTPSRTPPPSATFTPTVTLSPTPTTTPSCTGDCDGNGEVAVDDIILMVSIGQGLKPVSACAAGNANHDNGITVEEILLAVNAALNGC